MKCPICRGPVTWDKSQIEDILGFVVMEDPARPGLADHYYACLRCGRVFRSHGGRCVWWPTRESLREVLAGVEALKKDLEELDIQVKVSLKIPLEDLEEEGEA